MAFDQSNYTLFLEGVKLAGFDNVLKAKKAAAFVPDDENFCKYMAKKGFLLFRASSRTL